MGDESRKNSSMPLRRGGMARGRAFFWGQLSAAIEPLAGVVGAALVLTSAAFLPHGMGAAAWAMLYVVAEELIPETVRSARSTSPHLALSSAP